MKKAAFALAAVVLSSTGCATKEYVQEYVDGKVTPVGQRVDKAEAGIRRLQYDYDGTSRTAQEALSRAEAAGKLAEGKFMYQVELTDDTLRFAFDSAELSDTGRQALDAFADKLKSENKNVYVEIQGYTDAKGTDAYNLKLSDARSESVRRYLSMKDGIALNRLDAIGYGESAPVADNKTHDGRARNRRVVLVVLR